MCLGCEALEARASWLDCRTGDEGVLKTCWPPALLELDAGGPSISSILRTGGWVVGRAGPVEDGHRRVSLGGHGSCGGEGRGDVSPMSNMLLTGDLGV